MSSSTPMLKRGEACTECRRRKLRCDGAKPFCTICVKANRECRYEKLVIRPVHVVLQERFAKLRDKFLSLSGGNQADAAGPSGTAMTPTQDQPDPSETTGHTSVQIAPTPLQDMAGNWWEAEALAPRIRDYLLNIFIQNMQSVHFQMHVPTFLARLASNNPQERPHPAFLESIYLVACYFSSGFQPSQSLAHHEEHFLARAREALMDSLSYSDRLMDFLRGSILVTQYLFLRARFLEGYHVHCGAARFALSCGLHRLTSSVFQPGVPAPPSPNIVLIPAPSSQIELGERIMTFWMIYLCDKMSSIIAGFVGALPTENDEINGIRTVFPRTMEDYQTGSVSAEDDETVMGLLASHEAALPPKSPGYKESSCTTTLKALTILERAVRLGAAYRVQGHAESTLLSLRQLEAVAKNFMTTVPPIEDLNLGQTLPAESVPAFVARTTGLGGLMEVYHTLIDVDERAYDARLACAKGLAELAKIVGDEGFSKGNLMSTGYCWCLAAQVLIQHIRTGEDRTDEDEALLSNIVTALEKLSLAFPTLVHQFKQVQQALGSMTEFGQA